MTGTPDARSFTTKDTKYHLRKTLKTERVRTGDGASPVSTEFGVSLA
jgi:hypothetical protein